MYDKNIKSKLEGFTLIEQEESSTNVNTFLIKEIGTLLRIIKDGNEIVYEYNGRSYFSTNIDNIINHHIKRDYEVYLLKKSNKYKKFIGKIEEIINQKIPDDFNSLININLKNNEELSFNISNLRRFTIYYGERDLHMDYIPHHTIISQKQLFEYLRPVYKKGEK